MATKEEQVRQLQREIMLERADQPCGAQRDIVIYINHAVGTEYTIEFIQQIEKALDEALTHVGFTRKSSTKGDVCEFEYWQFGQAVNGT